MGAKTRTTGFYRDDAARLAADAAKIVPPTEPTLNSRRPVSESTAPTIVIDDPARPALAPEPAINQNRQASRQLAAAPRERRSIARILAWIVLAPFYVASIVGSAALLVLAAKFFLKL